MANEAVIPKFAKGEEELVRRLGIAVAYEWNMLSPSIQDQLLDLACQVEVWPTGVDMREALKIFLQKDRSGNSTPE